MDDPNPKEDRGGWETDGEEGWIFELPKGAWERQELKNRELRERLLRGIDRAKDEHRPAPEQPPKAEEAPPSDDDTNPSGDGWPTSPAAPPPLIVRRRRDRPATTWDDVFSTEPASDHNPTAPAAPTEPFARFDRTPPPPNDPVVPAPPVPELPPIARRREREPQSESKWEGMFDSGNEAGSIVDAMREWVERSRARNQAARETPPAAPPEPTAPPPAAAPDAGPGSRLGGRWTLGPRDNGGRNTAQEGHDESLPGSTDPLFDPERPSMAPTVETPPAHPGWSFAVDDDHSARPTSPGDSELLPDEDEDEDWRPLGQSAPGRTPPATFGAGTTAAWQTRPPLADSASAASDRWDPTEKDVPRSEAEEPSRHPAFDAGTPGEPGAGSDPWPATAPSEADTEPAWNVAAQQPTAYETVDEPARDLAPQPPKAQEPADEPAWEADSWRPARMADRPMTAPRLPAAPSDDLAGDTAAPAWDSDSWRPSRIPAALEVDSPPVAHREAAQPETTAWEADGWESPAAAEEPTAAEGLPLPESLDAAGFRSPTWADEGSGPSLPVDETTPSAGVGEGADGRVDHETHETPPPLEPAPPASVGKTLPDEFDWRDDRDRELEDSVLVRAFNAKAASAAAPAAETSFVELLGEGADELVAEVADPATSRFTTAAENWGQSYLPPLLPPGEDASIYRVPMVPEEPAPVAPPAEFVRPQAHGRGLVRALVETALLALLVFLGVRASFQNFRVDGVSMFPTLEDGEFLLVNKLVYSEVDMGKLGKYIPFIDGEEGEVRSVFHAPHRGDIVVLVDPRRPDVDLIKRVIGLPGETVEIRNGKVYINDYELEEPYIVAPWNDTRPKITVPEGQYYVLGDNRNNSMDSRSPAVGLVPKSLIIGKAVLTYWPLGKFGLAPNAPGKSGGPELTTTHISAAEGPRTAVAGR